MQRFFEGKKWLLLIAIVLAGSHARAQGTKDTLILNLDKALEIALSDNPTIKVAEEEIALKKVSRKETWQNLLPEASITGSMSHTITAPQFSIGDQIVKMGQDKANTAAGTLNISLPLFAPSVYRAMSMTKTDIELAVEKSRASKLDLVNQVTKAYYQLMLSQDSYEVLLKSYELAEENYNIVNAKYQQGAVSEFDKITAEVQMRSVKPSVISAGNAVTLSKLQLKVLMGVTADVEIKIDDSLAAYESIVFANQLENDAHEGLVNNTTMKQLELNRLMLQKNIKSLRTNFMPTIGLGYSYQYQSMNNDSWNIFDYHYSGSSSLVFNLTIPLYKASNANKDRRVRPGMFARATLNFGTKNNVVVPDLAIVKQSGSGDRYVYVYKDGKVTYNKVELGRRMGAEYELISGVPDNSRVVIAGQTKLVNGMEVEIAVSD